MPCKNRLLQQRKIFIAGSIGRKNVGDDAICISLTKLLKNMFNSNVSICIFAKDKRYFMQNFKKDDCEIRFVSSFIEIFKGFMDSKFVVIGGGDYIGDNGLFLHNLRTFWMFLSLGLLVKLSSKKLVMINSGFFVETGYGLAFLKLILKLTHCISVRDNRSKLLVSKYTQKRVVAGFDTVALLETEWKKNTVPCNNIIKNIGFSITPAFLNNRLTPEEIEGLAKIIVRNITSVMMSVRTIKIHFLVLNTDSTVGELNLIHQIKQQLLLDVTFVNRVELIMYDGNLSDFLSQFSELDAIICCKYHSIIFSYLFEKPMIVLGYHPKNVALVDDIALPKRAFLSFDDIVDGKLRLVLLELLRNSEQFKAKLPVIVAKRKALNGVLECMERSNLI